MVEVYKEMPYTKYQRSRPSSFKRRRILKFALFVPIFKLVTHEAGQVLIPGASYEQTWYKSKKRCCIPNIKALGLPVSKLKNFEVGPLWYYIPTCAFSTTPRQGKFWPQGHHINTFGRDPQRDAIYQISKL